MRPYLLDVMTWLHARVPKRNSQRILDLGTGTGTGTIALATRFPGAEVVAIDKSTAMLERVRERVTVSELAGRVSTVQMDLDGSWTDLGSYDVVWASAALHELSSPDRTFSNILEVLNPGGLLVVVEMDGPPRFLQDEIGGGLEARIHDVLREVETGSAYRPEWTKTLDRAGFAPVEVAAFSVDMAIEGAETGGKYAQTYLRRIQPHVAARLSASDRTMLDALVADVGSSSLRHREDLRLRAGRTAWAGYRP
ncbi:methyltransferase family protein [Antricoccus suffuscus]|uniref:Methyltransferase family protein n=2 Tax=Antricoccus suffuscus TaxID=1629062 RepID=A0A2T0ZVU6_9ACTN|nr:methyltransferase family protein [Antricoccus suffuscus]